MTSHDTFSVKPPGRLGDPASTPATDPRMNRKLLRALAEFGLDGHSEDPPVTRFSPEADRHAALDAFHAGMEQIFEVVAIDDPQRTEERVSRRVVQIPGLDGNTIDLYVFTPLDVAPDAPAVLYIHGGGMAFVNADSRGTRAWSREIAGHGAIVIAVDFRNSHVGGPNPFPAGLHDCISAVKWAYANRAELGVSRIVLEGESGGANLALATALSANRDGWSDQISGVYAVVPYISGLYGVSREEKLQRLPSLVENDGYAVNVAAMDINVVSYDPEGIHSRNPLAWPYFAEESDVRGLPPHVIVVDELDPLRDEGIAYFRKLQDAEVSVIGRMNLGITHASSSVFRNGTAEYFDATAADVVRFAKSVPGL